MISIYHYLYPVVEYTVSQNTSLSVNYSHRERKKKGRIKNKILICPWRDSRDTEEVINALVVTGLKKRWHP